jgi:hypothetical protein
VVLGVPHRESVVSNCRATFVQEARRELALPPPKAAAASFSHVFASPRRAPLFFRSLPAGDRGTVSDRFLRANRLNLNTGCSEIPNTPLAISSNRAPRRGVAPPGGTALARWV